MSSQHPVCLLVAEDLHHAVSVVVGFGAAVGCEGELADSVWDALRTRGAQSKITHLLNCAGSCSSVLDNQKFNIQINKLQRHSPLL